MVFVVSIIAVLEALLKHFSMLFNQDDAAWFTVLGIELHTSAADYVRCEKDHIEVEVLYLPEDGRNCYKAVRQTSTTDQGALTTFMPIIVIFVKAAVELGVDVGDTVKGQVVAVIRLIETKSKIRAHRHGVVR
ncbi:hypothetical protein FPQ18DRAFT_311313 [Pyronema domesticum]|nr:hypothetical protein FPQ18DRAFT_311313 [Pyronema domesticum]